MKKIILAVLATAVVALAYYGQSIRMTKVGSRALNYQWAECYYQSYLNSGFGTITITVQGSVYSCPYSINYYPGSGTWSR